MRRIPPLRHDGLDLHRVDRRYRQEWTCRGPVRDACPGRDVSRTRPGRDMTDQEPTRTRRGHDGDASRNPRGRVSVRSWTPQRHNQSHSRTQRGHTEKRAPARFPLGSVGPLATVRSQPTGSGKGDKTQAPGRRPQHRVVPQRAAPCNTARREQPEGTIE